MDKQLDTNKNITNKLPLPKVIKAIFVSRVQCATLYRVAHWIPRNRLTFDHEELRPKTTWVTTSRWSAKRGSTGGIRIKWTENFGAGEGGFWRLNKWGLVTRCSKPCLLFLEGNDILPYFFGGFFQRPWNKKKRMNQSGFQWFRSFQGLFVAVAQVDFVGLWEQKFETRWVGTTDFFFFGGFRVDKFVG